MNRNILRLLPIRHDVVLLCAALMLVNSLAGLAAAARRFDIVTFCCPCTLTNHLCTPQFDALNRSTNATLRNGHFLAMGTDAHRAEINANGNFLAAYYDDLNTGWSNTPAAQKADDIEYRYIRQNFTNTGVKTTWVILNEISADLWPTNQAYRTWVGNVVSRLKNKYGHSVILFAPFANPGRHNEDWKRVSRYAYIGVENFLSGQEIKSNRFSVRWCRDQYRKSKKSYLDRKVPADKIYLVEHFAQTKAGIHRGRSGVSATEWDKAIEARNAAARQVRFAGFVSYAWGKNAMLVSDTELIHFENTYAAMKLP